MNKPVRERTAIAYRPSEENADYVARLVEHTGLSRNVIVDALITFSREKLNGELVEFKVVLEAVNKI